MCQTCRRIYIELHLAFEFSSIVIMEEIAFNIFLRLIIHGTYALKRYVENYMFQWDKKKNWQMKLCFFRTILEIPWIEHIRKF